MEEKMKCGQKSDLVLFFSQWDPNVINDSKIEW